MSVRNSGGDAANGSVVTFDGTSVTIITPGNLQGPSSPLTNDASGEPAAKRARLEEDLNTNLDTALSIKQILFNINKAICLRLDSIENKLETVNERTKALEDKLEQLHDFESDNSAFHIHGTPHKDGSSMGDKNRNAVLVGLPQSKTPTSSDDGTPERYAVQMAGQNSMSPHDQGVSSLGPNVTLITLNSEDDFPHGTWLGDENNLEMRVRVPVTPSDLLHIHSNCRSPEKMALTLLDYLFDRETQANSNLSGMGKHGKRQLDPLMIYGIRCHLIHRFGISEQDWHRIKQNVDSKCRTAFRRRVRGLPLTVKAFRGKAPPTYLHVTTGGNLIHSVQELGDTSDDSLQQIEDSELHIQETEVDGVGMIQGTAAELLQGAGGQIQVLHATPEQVAQLQQTHQIQILQGDHLMQLQGTGDSQDGLHVAVSLAQPGDIQVVKTETGETLHISGASLRMADEVSQKDTASDSEQ